MDLLVSVANKCHPSVSALPASPFRLMAGSDLLGRISPSKRNRNTTGSSTTAERIYSWEGFIHLCMLTWVNLHQLRIVQPTNAAVSINSEQSDLQKTST